MPAGAFGDSTSGMALAGGIAAALVKKARTGEGSIVEGALLADRDVGHPDVDHRRAGRGSRRDADADARSTRSIRWSTPTATGDGRWLQLCMMQADRFWPGFCQAIGREDLIDDPRFVDAETRLANVEECVAEFDATFAIAAALGVEGATRDAGGAVGRRADGRPR